MPAVSWTTIPPAKSFTPLTKSEPSAPDKRPPPQIQCVTGAYTKIIQSDEKNNTKEKILIVTSPKHALRMSLLLSSHGFLFSRYKEEFNNTINIYSFIPDVRSINSINASLYEYMAIIKYIFKRYIIIGY